VTMPRVAQRSGVSRANLYQHFVSKDHLIAAAYADIKKRLEVERFIVDARG